MKKPKVAAHLQRCHAQYLSCIDCSETFDRRSVQVSAVTGAPAIACGRWTAHSLTASHLLQKHSQCVSEVDKYANGITKPGYVCPCCCCSSKGPHLPG